MQAIGNIVSFIGMAILAFGLLYAIKFKESDIKTRFVKKIYKLSGGLIIGGIVIQVIALII